MGPARNPLPASFPSLCGDVSENALMRAGTNGCTCSVAVVIAMMRYLKFVTAGKCASVFADLCAPHGVFLL